MRRIAISIGLVVGLVTSRASAVEPWSDPDPAAPPARIPIGGSVGFRGGAEYRANGVMVRPLDLSATEREHFSAIEHRLRLDAGLDHEDKVRLVTSVDVLDAVLWGDNGTVGDDVTTTAGANASTVNVNSATTCMRQIPGRQSGLNESYTWGLCNADPVFVRRLYADVITPVGLIRFGRQAFTEGASLSVNDGDGRKNRFGFARRGNSADRILFATKPLEAFKPKDLRDRSETKGVFFIAAYDRLVSDSPMLFSDDLHNWITAIRWLEPQHALGGDFEARLYHAYRWSKANDADIHAFGGRAMSRIGDFHAGFEAVVVAGSTREIGEAFRVISNDPPVDQTVRQLGARATVRWDKDWLTLYLEGDYASGDSDPQTRTPLTQFRFADDSNVGLLMFKHVIAYQTARAAAAGTSLLRDLGAPSYPLDQIATRGAFVNAAAIFPQFDVRPMKDLLLRGGVLMAWAPAKYNDPLASLQRRDGSRIEDDLVNFNGGSTDGRYYGTELDGRIQYRAYDHFIADLEGAILFPGSALQDANGDAVNSWLLQARGTVFF